MKQQEYYFEIEDNADSEVIVWNKYSDEKPKDGRKYLVDYGGSVSIEIFMPNSKRFSFDLLCEPIAWAELPKGWKEEQE